MARNAIWKSIAAAVQADIGAGRYRPGDRLPTEAALATRFGVNRHTVRHALADLVALGLVHTRRGSGAFVTARPTDYPLGRRVRFHQNVAATGRTASRRISRAETVPCDGAEAEALGLSTGAPVHVVEGVSLADGQPVAAFRSVFPADRLPGFLDHVRAQGSVTAALVACGVADYTRAQTRLTAKLATAMQALRLDLREGAPILRSVAVNVDAAGRPVEYGTTWFAGDRVTLTVTPDG